MFAQFLKICQFETVWQIVNKLNVCENELCSACGTA